MRVVLVCLLKSGGTIRLPIVSPTELDSRTTWTELIVDTLNKTIESDSGGIADAINEGLGEEIWLSLDVRVIKPLRVPLWLGESGEDEIADDAKASTETLGLTLSSLGDGEEGDVVELVSRRLIERLALSLSLSLAEGEGREVTEGLNISLGLAKLLPLSLPVVESDKDDDNDRLELTEIRVLSLSLGEDEQEEEAEVDRVLKGIIETVALSLSLEEGEGREISDGLDD